MEKLRSIIAERLQQGGKSEIAEISDFDANAIVTIILKSLDEISPDLSMPLNLVVPCKRPYMNAIDTYTVLPGTNIKHGYDISTNTKTGKVRMLTTYNNGIPCGFYAFADDNGKIKYIGSRSADGKRAFGIELSWDEDHNPSKEIIYDINGNPKRTRIYCKGLCCFLEDGGMYIGQNNFIHGRSVRYTLSKTAYCVGRTMQETGYDMNDLTRMNFDAIAPSLPRPSPGIDLEPFLQLLPYFKPIVVADLGLEKE